MRPLLTLLVLLPLAACGDDAEPDRGADPTDVGQDGFSVTRADGSTFEVDGPFTVECVPSEDIPGTTLLRAYEPHEPEGVWFEFRVVPERVGPDGRAYDFPYSTPEDDPEQMVFFLVDPEGNNELSSAQGTVGGLRVVSATCDPVAHVVVQVDGELGSEFSDLDGVTIEDSIDLRADG